MTQLRKGLMVVGMCVLRAAEALYSGNPDEPELIDNGLFLAKDVSFGIKAGYQGDFVFDRRLHLVQGAHCKLDDFQSRMNQGVLAFNFLNRLEVFGSTGSMTANMSFRPHDGKRREFQTNDHITWGAGARALLFNWGNAHVGATGAYQYSNPPLKWCALDGRTFSTEAKLKYWEWQVAALIAYRVEIFDPYIGVVYSSAESILYHVDKHDMQLDHRRLKMKSRDRVGMALGCSLTPSTIVDLTIEVRLFDEEGLSFVGNIKF